MEICRQPVRAGTFSLLKKRVYGHPRHSFGGLLLMAVLPVLAQEGNPSREAVLPAVEVSASADASSGGLSPAYHGGQVARGGRAGILGTRDAMETPFSINSYTAELIQNQQARSVRDVLQNDASVRTARGYGNFQESYFIRGFLLGSDDIAYNGLYSLLPRQYIASELFERVEVLRGASAFLSGASPSGSGIGGSINLLPKRAPNDPLSQVNLGAANGGQKSASFDVARRFGDDQRLGLRVVGTHREGGTPVAREQGRLDAFLTGFDWKTRDIRLSADIGHQNHRLRHTRPSVTLGAGATNVPSAPDNTRNWAQPWTHSDERDFFASARGEYDFNENFTAYAAAGMRDTTEDNLLSGITVGNGATGAGTINARFDNTRKDKIATGEIGLRGKLRTGAVDHTLVASYSAFHFNEKGAWAMSSGTPATNLYDPVTIPLPALAFGGGDKHHLKTVAKTRLSSFAIGDTLSMLDERLLLTLGMRHQTLKINSYDYNTGDKTSRYDQSKTSPMASIVARPLKNLSFYGNYIEGLTQGETAPAALGGTPVKNAGQALSPYVSEQKEIGVRYEYGTLGMGLAFFTTKKPRGIIDSNAFFKSSGKDIHRGIELNVYGEAARNLRVLGGITWLDARQERTGDARTEGKRVIGVPARQANLNVEWDVPGAPGLTFDARVIATSSSRANAENTLRVPGWHRFDIGARYLFALGEQLVTVRARIENVADRDYWSSVGGYPGAGYLVSSMPRTFMLTGSAEF
jgi:iron complex outermembrane receptor protein